ncbi:translation initiation factor [Candidatus Woesearchaeota archaeon]|nr:translation initiation factor [Candidatus Woesearchaeota archaeon]
MGEICSKCGLPQELCVCETIAKENQLIEVKSEKRKFGKQYTVITGIDTKEIDLDQLGKKLRQKFACGGTVKGGIVELQGNHRQRVREVLIQMGFAPETIVVK